MFHRGISIAYFNYTYFCHWKLTVLWLFENLLKIYKYLVTLWTEFSSWTSWRWTPSWLIKKFQNAIFKRYWKFLWWRCSYRSITLPISFFLKYLNKYSRYRCPNFRPKWAMTGRLFEMWPKIFFQIKFLQTPDEQMLKISRKYLDSCLSYSKMTKNLF